MSNLVIALLDFGDNDLSRRALRHYQLLSRQCTEISLHLLAVGGADPQSRALATAAKVDYVECASDSPDPRHECALLAARGSAPDAVALVGSSDMISIGYFLRAMRALTNDEADATGLLDCFLIDVHSQSAWHWAHGCAGENLSGLVVSRHFLDDISRSSCCSSPTTGSDSGSDRNTIVDDLILQGARVRSWRMSDVGCRYWRLQSDEDAKTIRPLLAAGNDAARSTRREWSHFQAHLRTLDIYDLEMREAALPMSFDQWRKNYDSLTYTEHCRYYDAVYEQFPVQCHCNVGEARAFFQQLPQVVNVFEIGGWDGRMADVLLPEFSSICHWTNCEICRPAAESHPPHERYSILIPARWVWELERVPEAEVLFASHSLEHLRAAQVDRLLQRLPTVTAAYVEAPLVDIAEDYTWMGDVSTHILELGWQQLEALFARHAFRVLHRAPNVRWFVR